MKKNYVHNLVLKLIVLMALETYIIVSAFDPSPLQDFCVATDDPKKMSFVNGKFCKDPKKVTADDFFYRRIDGDIDTNNIWGANGNVVNATTLPGLNTQGLELVYFEYAPNGLGPPYIIPRSSELMVVLEGKITAGFVTSNQDGNRLFTKTLHKGDVFVFPQGLVHFHFNAGHKRAIALLVYGSQNAGYINLANSLFESRPRISPNLLSKAFQLNKSDIERLQKISWPRFG